MPLPGVLREHVWPTCSNRDQDGVDRQRLTSRVCFSADSGLARVLPVRGLLRRSVDRLRSLDRSGCHPLRRDVPVVAAPAAPVPLHYREQPGGGSAPAHHTPHHEADWNRRPRNEKGH